MSARTNFKNVTTTILAVLNEDSDKEWTQARLARAVSDRTGVKNTGRIEVMIRALVAAGTVGGRMNWAGTDAQHITAAAADAAGSEAQAERIKTLETALQRSVDVIREVKADAEAKVEEVREEMKNRALDPVVEVVLKRTPRSKKTKRTKETFHGQFRTMLDLAQARMNIFIYGPTGCGKSHVCEQLARALDLPFAFVSCSAGMSEGVLGGRLLPTGENGRFEYIISEFVKVYENGGVFLLDEIDAADANVLLFINAALANGRCNVPGRTDNPTALKHDDFICIAAANTAGTGGDRMYSGRNKLDGATLDRFQVGKLVFDYDKNVEEMLVTRGSRDDVNFKSEGEDDEVDRELLERCWKIREAINDHRLERAMSTRFIKDAYKMKHEFGWGVDQLDASYFAGWREDEVAKVRTYLD